MKKTLMTIAGCLLGLTFNLSIFAQQANLEKDQNPRYEQSRAKYMNMSDSLTRNQGTTIQQTYKAYDWYEAREERRKLRRETNYNNGLYNNSYYGGLNFYPTMRFNNWGYGNYGRGYFRRGFNYGW